jgi:recombination associated protein RdgC
MFTNCILFSAAGDIPDLDTLAEAMQAGAFVAPGPTQPDSFGWIPPRGIEGGPLIESIGGHWIAMVMIERRLLPAAVVKRRLQQVAKEFEKSTGRAPSKRMLKDMKAEVTLDLLPRAFTRQVRVPVWIDPKRKLVVIDAGSAGRAEVAATALIAAAPRMNLHGLRTVSEPSACMTHWVAQDQAPEGMVFEREIELRGIGGDSGAPAVITCTDVEWSETDVQGWMDDGLRVARLGLTFGERVSFVLHGNGHLKGIEYLKVSTTKLDPDEFDGTFTLITGELLELLEPLIASMGGIAPLPIEAAAAEETDGAHHEEEEPTS